jgi:hypothetical protein
VGERIAAHDGLVRLNEGAGQVTQQAAGLVDLLGANVGVELEGRPRLEDHHQLFHRGVAGALADAIDRALDLAGPFAHRGKRVRHGQAEIIVAVHAEHHLIDATHALAQAAHEGCVLAGNGVSHRVGDVDGHGSRLDGGLHDLHQIVHVAARCVLG